MTPSRTSVCAICCTCTHARRPGIEYTLTNEGLEVGDMVFPISTGQSDSDAGTYKHRAFDFRKFMTGFPDEPAKVIDLAHSDYKPYQIRTSDGYGPIEKFFKVAEIKPLYGEWVGKRVRKARGRNSEPNLEREPKPFKSGLKENTVKSVITHPQLGTPAFTFEEDDSYVECKRCHLITEAE
jgi:hypothetical protein